MPTPVGPRVLVRRGTPLRIRPKKGIGFDYPTTLVGTSQWLGSDGRPVTVYMDTSTGTTGLSVAQHVLAAIEGVMTSCDAWFGVRGLSGNVIVAPDFGGAYHYGCDFSSGGDWYLSLSAPDTTVGLAVAEITESYMGLQARGWNCGGSGGEALSRVLAEIATGGAAGAMVDYSAGPSWDGANWIDRDSGTDQDYPSTGCGCLYLWWLISQGYTVERIVQAGESGGALAGNYRTVTGDTTTGAAWTKFRAAVAAAGGASATDDDNIFRAPNPVYPAGGTPPPPPPPPPSTLLDTTGTLTLGDQTYPVELVLSLVDAGTPTSNISLWALLKDIAQIVAAIATQDPVQIAAAVGQLLSDLGLKSTPADRDRIAEKLRRSGTVQSGATVAETVASEVKPPPKR